MKLDTNLFNLTQPGMREFFNSIGEKPYRSTQLMKWMYNQGEVEIEKMTDLSKQLREQLALTTSFQLPEIISEQISVDGTRKWKMRVDNLNSIETVFIPEVDRWHSMRIISSWMRTGLQILFDRETRIQQKPVRT